MTVVKSKKRFETLEGARKLAILASEEAALCQYKIYKEKNTGKYYPVWFTMVETYLMK